MAKGGWQEFSRAESLQRAAPASEPTPKGQQRVRVQRTKAGKGGKMVTAITGLEAPEAELKALLKQLKAAAGTGGARELWPCTHARAHGARDGREGVLRAR